MTPERIAKLRKLHKASTQSEWWGNKPDDGDKEFAIGVGPDRYDGSVFMVDYDDVDGKAAVANAKYAVAACNAVPELLTEVESLTRALEQARGYLPIHDGKLINVSSSESKVDLGAWLERNKTT